MLSNKLKSFCIAVASVISSLTYAQQKPNIVFILVDDIGWSDLACYGNMIHETPNIDVLAKESVRFTNAYAASPVCTPTRASLMTGKFPARLHMTIWREDAVKVQQGHMLLPPVAVPDLPLEEFTIAEVFKKQGYNTAHIGKWHLGESEFYPENQGFDINIAGGSWGCPATFFYPYRGIIYKSQRYMPGIAHSVEGNYFSDRKGEYLTDRLTDEAIMVMKDGVRMNAPFFLNLCYYNVHTPIEAPDILVQYYSDKLAKTGNKSNPVYAAMVNKVDQNVGRILKTIQDLGINENTVVIFASDNGGFIDEWDGRKVTDNSPLRSGKGSLYEGGIRIPLIIRYPGISKPGTICNTPVCSTDLYPTFCGFAGIETNTFRIDGFSLLPLIRSSKAELPRDYLFWHYPHYYSTTTPASAVRFKDWKLIKYYEDNRFELYDLKNDIGEKNDLVKENADMVNILSGKLEEWLQETGASFPSTNPDYSVK